MATNIGPRIGIDGYNTYKAEMNAIIAQIENYKAQCDALGTSTEDLKQKEKLLTEEIRLQTDLMIKQSEWNTKVREVINQKASITERDNAVMTENQTVLLRQETELNRLTAEYDKAVKAEIEMGTASENASQKISGATIAMAELFAEVIKKSAQLVKQAAEIGINYNASMETYNAAFTTLLGSADDAADALQRVRDLSKIAPTFSTDALAQATQMIVATGKGAEESTEAAKALANAVAASGGGNEQLKRMAQNLQQIGNAGKATSIDIRQFAYAGINVTQLLADYTGKTAEEISGMTITYDLLVGALKNAAEENGRYFNGLENQTKTYNGQVAALKKNLQEGLGYAFKGVTDTIKNDVIPTFNDFISDTDNIDKVINAIKTLAPVLGTLAAAGQVTKFLNGTSTAAKLLTGEIKILGAATAALPFIEVTAGLIAFTEGVKAVKREIDRVENLGVLGDGKTVEEYTANVEKQRENLEKLQQQYEQLALYGGDLTEADKQLADARSALTNAEKELAEATAAATEELEKAAAVESNATPTAKYDAILLNAKESLDALKESYNEYYKAAEEAARKEFDLFEEVGALEYTSTAALQSNLQTQIDFWDSYAANLAIVSDKQSGLSQELLAYLSDGSTESAAYLASIVADIMAAGGVASEEGQQIIQTLNGKFAELQLAQSKYATESATTMTDLEGSIQKIVDETTAKLQELDLTDELYTDGINTLQSYISGLGSQLSALEASAFTWGQSLSISMQNGVNSFKVSLPRLSTIGLYGSQIPGFAKGLDYVPEDNYLAALHKGEMVLTEAQANMIRSGKYQKELVEKGSTYSYGGVNINVYAAEGQSEKAIAENVAYILQHEIDKKGDVYK